MIKVRILREVGSIAVLRIHWGECSNCLGLGVKGYHNAHSAPIMESSKPRDHDLNRDLSVDEFPDELWPKACDHCGEKAPEPLAGARQIFVSTRYMVQGDGEIVNGPLRTPGDLWPVPCVPECCEWTNCSGTHWNIVLPDRCTMDLSSRASNCGKPGDAEHRCWVLHGDPPLTANKAGHTCAAGGGSIDTGRWHGHLVSGVLSP